MRFHCYIFPLYLLLIRGAWSWVSVPSKRGMQLMSVCNNDSDNINKKKNMINRRNFSLQNLYNILCITTTTATLTTLNDKNSVVNAYTPDSDRLRESLYFISRVQEATVQQERLVRNQKLSQKELKTKMQLSLKLVERSYRLLDQINYASMFVDNPQDNLVIATEAGEEANEALNDAIQCVKNDLEFKDGPISPEQKELLISSLTETREKLFVFVKYMPQDKLNEARKRVEVENVDNREEFDGDIDPNAGVYNPVKLPWKE